MQRPARPVGLSLALVVVASLVGVACGGDDRSPTAVESVDEESSSTTVIDAASATSTVTSTARSSATSKAPDGGATPSSSSSTDSTLAAEGTSNTGSTNGSNDSTNTSNAPATTNAATTAITTATTTATPTPTVAAPTAAPTVAPTNAPAPPATNAPAPPPNPSLLASLRIEPEYPTGYDRDLFRHWIDADGDGCDTRREVLIAEAIVAPQVGSGCSLTNGRWYSAYDAIETTDPSGFDIDHLIALKEAWDSGAWNWTADQRRAFANDLSSPLSLIAVTASTNRSKSDRDPAEWLPPLVSYRCTYADSWVRVKIAWNLSVDQAEHDALAGILAGC